MTSAIERPADAESRQPAIQLVDITVTRGRARLLDRLSLSVAGGEILAVTGPSGAGKTTLLRVLLGLDTPTAGVVRLRGRAVSEGRRILVPPEDRGLAMVFQDLALWPHLTVREHLAFGLAARGVARGERAQRIHDTLARVGLADRAARYPGELSGGERQRVAIARALVLEPDAVLLDEPLSNLDIVLKRELLALLRELLGGGRVAAIYVTHDPREAAALADRIAVLERGRLVQAGTAEELRKAPATDFVRIFIEEMTHGRDQGA